MCKGLRLALPAVIAVAVFVGMAGSDALAFQQCPSPLPVGELKASLNPASCGSSPFRAYWSVGHGNPALLQGIDNGAFQGVFAPGPSGSILYRADWAESDNDNCALSVGTCGGFGAQSCLTGGDCPGTTVCNFSGTPCTTLADCHDPYDSACVPGPGFCDHNNLAPIAALFNGETGTDTPGHAGTVNAFSVDLSEHFQQYVLDHGLGLSEASLITLLGNGLPGPESDCATLGAPSVTDNANGTVNFTIPAFSVGDDCSTNPAAVCSGGSRDIRAGFQLYTSEQPCKVGPLTGNRLLAGWTAVGGVVGNSGTNFAIAPPALNNGKCKFVAYGPVFDSGFTVRFLSAHAATALGGNGDADGDGILDKNDFCPFLNSTNNADTDGDGVGDACDNCPNTPNPTQANTDGDAFGDACDKCPSDTNNDSDNDGVCNGATFNPALGTTAGNDNCPNTPNPTQADSNHNGIGDACDICTTAVDSDGDHVCDDIDNCPTVYNPNQADADGDAVGDACDTCPYEKFNDQDADGFCACDVKLEWAGLCGPSSNNCKLGSTQPCDNCRKVANPDQAPSGFNDGLGDRCEDKINLVKTSAGPPPVFETTAVVFPTKAGAAGFCSLRTCFFHRGTVCNQDKDCSVISSYDFCAGPRSCFIDADCKRVVQEGNCAGNDNGFGDGAFRFQTSQEWNCPRFQLVYRSPFGDRDTGIAFNCKNCVNGKGFFGINTFYGTRAGAHVNNAHGGNNLILKTIRTRTSPLCKANENPPSVVNSVPETAVRRTR